MYVNYAETKRVASDKEVDAHFGISVALDGDTEMMMEAKSVMSGWCTTSNIVHIFMRYL